MTADPIEGIYCPALEKTRDAEVLAERLDLPLLTKPVAGPYLLLSDEWLGLVADARSKPIVVDFVAGRMGHRYRHGGGKGQTLAKAAGLKGGRKPNLIDATAGLGRDAFVLAALGCRVRLIERSPLIAALLSDGIERASRCPMIGDMVRQRMRLYQGDAQSLLPALLTEEEADVIYLDPMYPERKKRALVKKEMRLFRQLIGPDPDGPALLALARRSQCQRVVVKRPRLGVSLSIGPADLTMTGKSTRYDVYFNPL